MKLPLKILLAVVGLAVVVAIGLAVAVVVLFDPKDYQPLLESSVEKSTGRKLTLAGDLGLNLFPCCSIQLGRTTLGNPPGFPAGDFASVESAELSIRVWPLITSREVRIGKVRLDGLNADLLARADGTANWQFESATPEDETVPPDESGAGELLVKNIEGIEIRKGRVAYRDEKAKADYLAEDIGFETGDVRPGEPFDFRLSAKLTDRADGSTGTIALKTRATFDDDASRLTLEKPALDVTATGKAIPAKSLTAKLGAAGLVVETKQDTKLRFKGLEGEFSMPGMESLAGDVVGSFVAEAAAVEAGPSTEITLPKLAVDLTVSGKDIPGDTITAKILAGGLAVDADKMRGGVESLAVDLNGLGAKMSVNGRGKFGDDGADLAGTLKIDPLSPRSVLAVLKKPEPKTADPKALTRFSGTAAWALGKDSLNLTDVSFRLDDTLLAGSLGFAPLDKPVTRFDLKLDAIDLDRYLEPDGKEGGDSRTAKDGEADDIPVETIRDLRLDGRLRIGALTFAKAKMSEVSVTLRAANGRLRMDPLAAKLYGGEYKGAVAIDATGQTAAVALEQQVSALQVGGVLKDLYQNDKLTGALTGRITANGTGNTSDAIVKTLAGSVALDLASGVYLGTDVWHEIRVARARLKRDEPPPAPAEPRTEIRAMKLAGDIAGGTLRTKELLAEIPFIRMTGDGALDLVGKKIDFRLKAAVVETPTFEDGTSFKDLNGLAIPLTLKGAMDEPKVGVDLKELAAGAAVQKLTDKLFKKLGGDEPAVDGAATGSTAQPAEPAKEEKPRDALKRSLRDLLKPKQ